MKSASNAASMTTSTRFSTIRRLTSSPSAPPNNQHASEAIRAAQAGKHIFVEKPIAINADDILVMLDAVASNHVHSLVAFILRFKPLVKLQRKLVSEGELGKIFMANVDYWFGRERKGWMKHKEQTGGAFILAGCHSVDMARFILDSDIVKSPQPTPWSATTMNTRP